MLTKHFTRGVRNKDRFYMQDRRRALKERRLREQKQEYFLYLLLGLCITFIAIITFLVYEATRPEYYVAPPRKLQEKTESALKIDFWDKSLKKSAMVDAPFVSQLPELPRGCEVTSLSMLLNHAGVDVDKLTLAEEVKKDKTPYSVSGGRIFFGNPYEGFVGDMYDRSRPGFAVFHGPIAELAEEYLPGRIIDLTGSDFEDILYPVSAGVPVWVMINVYYRELEDKYYQTWETANGKVRITYKTHSVLLTGYDETYVYFNDPLTNKKNRKVNRYGFEKAWKQMGSQAITYIPEK